MQAARELAPGSTRLVAAMTTAFAAGQLVGPLLVRGDDLTAPSLLAASVLLATAAALTFSPGRKGRPRADTTAGPHATDTARDDGPRPTSGCG
jgi:hypothetical protein